MRLWGWLCECCCAASGRVFDENTFCKHKNMAEKALNLCDEVLAVKKESLPSKVDLLVMDEVLNAISDGLITEKVLFEVLKKRGRTHVILTGRGASELLIKISDLATEMKKLKHLFDKGQLAVKGLDF